MIFAAILAGGVGSRMNIAGMPKQFLPLVDKPIILHTLEKFLICPRFDAVYVGVHEDWLLHMEDLVGKFVPDQRDRLRITAGGGDRNGTILSIIRRIKQDFGNNLDHIIVTHDSVRPFVTARIIEENIDAALRYGACDTVVPASDTIVCSENGSEVSSIPNRAFMYQGQTPQSFNMVMLEKLYLDLTQDEKAVLTDACKICVVRSQPVRLVMGEPSNIKITTVSDYRIAQAMLGAPPID